VPFIARWPGVVPAGSVSDQVIAFWDFLPTVAELCGSAPPPALDGTSYVNALRGKKQPAHPPLYWEFHEGRFAQAVRIGDWKGVRLNPGRPIELFDLTGDPGEKEDVSAKHPDVVKRMAELLDSCRTDSPDFRVSR
jgi:arylsulfatase A-like enzyme